GRGRALGLESPLLNQVLGGWTVSGIVRVQSGRPFYLNSGRSTYNQNDANVVLAPGVSADQIQGLIRLSPGPNGTMLYVDPQLIGADGRPNPQYLLSAATPGELGQRIWLYGPRFWNVDLGIGKRFTIGHAYVDFEGLFIDAFNHTAFLVGATS